MNPNTKKDAKKAAAPKQHSAKKDGGGAAGLSANLPQNIPPNLPQGEFGLLLELCRLIERTETPDDVLSPVLLMISDLYGAKNASFTLFSKENNEIYVDAAVGLTDTEQMRGRYKPGEGITGRVFSSGKRYIVPRVASDPNFLNKTRSIPSESSFICVPVKYATEVTGTLSVTLPSLPEAELERIAQFLSIITTLIAQPLVLKRHLQDMQSAMKSADREAGALDFSSAFLIGNSRPVRTLKTRLYEAAKSDAPVLLVGESGTGRTFIARALHDASARKTQALIRFNADDASVDAQAALFGSASKEGLLAEAKNTTLLIESADRLPPEAQQLLLTALQTREIPGSSSGASSGTSGGAAQKLTARIVLTSFKTSLDNDALSADLRDFLKSSTFFIPSLRERKDDITLLADHFLQEASKRQQKTIKRFSTPAIDLLCQYHWPGNLNEMQQVIEHAARICEGGVIHAHMFPPTLQSAESTNTVESLGLHDIVGNVETDIIIDALKVTRGNIKKAAKVLKVSNRILGLRIKKYGIAPTQYR